MKIAFFLTVIIAVVWCSTSIAQSNDMKITVSKPLDLNPPNSVGILSITIENIGPDSAAGLFNVASVSPTFPNSLFQSVSYTFLSGPCREIFPDVLPGDTFGAWWTDTLNAGEFATCQWRFEVDAEPFADSVLVTWQVTPSGGLFTDPDWANNSHSLVFAFSQMASIPTLVKPAAAFLMLVLLLMGLRQVAIRD